jgi:hypothetical protein
MQNSLISDKFPEFGIVRITLMVVGSVDGIWIIIIIGLVANECDVTLRAYFLSK